MTSANESSKTRRLVLNLESHSTAVCSDKFAGYFICTLYFNFSFNQSHRKEFVQEFD